MISIFLLKERIVNYKFLYIWYSWKFFFCTRLQQNRPQWPRKWFMRLFLWKLFENLFTYIYFVLDCHYSSELWIFFLGDSYKPKIRANWTKLRPVVILYFFPEPFHQVYWFCSWHRGSWMFKSPLYWFKLKILTSPEICQLRWKLA